MTSVYLLSKSLQRSRKKMVKKKTQDSKCMKYVKTACLCLAFLCLGLIIALPGPALPTLAYNLGVDIKPISVIFTARAIGYLSGSIISGFLHGKLDAYKMIGFSLLLTSAGFAGAPFFPSVVLLAIAMSTMGVSMGFLDTGGNVLCLEIWGDDSGPYMQSLHFSFALGATTAPLLAQPFIMEVIHNNDTTKNMTSVTQSYNFTPATETPPTLPTPDSGIPHVAWAFIICAIMTLIMALSFLYLSFSNKTHSVSSQEDTVKQEGVMFRLKMLVLLFLFFLVYVGIEVTFGVYVYTFAINSDKQYSKDSATMINSLFWGAFALGRFISIFVSKVLKPLGLISIDLVGTFIAAVILVCFPYYYDTADALLWVGTFIYGISMASIFPSGLSYAEQYITINGKAAASLVVGGALGEMLLPLTVGQLIEKHPMNLMYSVAICMVTTTIIFISLHWLASKRGKRLNENRKNEEEAYCSEELEELTENSNIKEEKC
nr:sodium-dependent glucose transporter 1-like [Ciona intestinalis]|eukprot:XP_002122926.3 sodium-dependent glucose transporter 1-like [Ciona intestinalis]